ncbi:MAG: 1-acyl-sn-glycerol-3-phosphate acyltransferase [Polyangiaceae bacterium]|nr:1-acyl-sn-glycerol-3-phosphate acyltransferase [Polyangiaceae bacterium]
MKTTELLHPPRVVPTESFFAIWARRAITIPGVFLLTSLVVGVAPVALPVLAALDVVRRNDFRLVRFYASIVVLIGLHPIGLVMLFDAFLRGGRLWGAPREREIRLTAKAEAWWANAMVQAAVFIYRMRVVIEGAEELAGGRVLVFMRHTSILDTMLPLAVIGHPFAKHVRYVMKREVLWNPCVDVVGHRIPTAFVRRGGTRDTSDIEQVKSLADNLGPEGIVIIYPEGTRFTKEKQAKRLADIQKNNPELFDRARTLQNVLPLHLGGSLALLSRKGDHDVAFWAHVGLEGAGKMSDWIGGALLGRTIRIKFFRVPSANVPQSDAARIHWLYEQWHEVDAWIEEQKAPSRR